MQILSETSLTPNGNIYQKSKKASTVGMALAGGSAAIKCIPDVIDTFSKSSGASKLAKASVVVDTALSVLVFAGLGKLFGGIFDNRVNKNRSEQVDILATEVAKYKNNFENADVEAADENLEAEETATDDFQNIEENDDVAKENIQNESLDEEDQVPVDSEDCESSDDLESSECEEGCDCPECAKEQSDEQ